MRQQKTGSKPSHVIHVLLSVLCADAYEAQQARPYPGHHLAIHLRSAAGSGGWAGATTASWLTAVPGVPRAAHTSHARLEAVRHGWAVHHSRPEAVSGIPHVRPHAGQLRQQPPLASTLACRTRCTTALILPLPAAFLPPRVCYLLKWSRVASCAAAVCGTERAKLKKKSDCDGCDQQPLRSLECAGRLRRAGGCSVLDGAGPMLQQESAAAPWFAVSPPISCSWPLCAPSP